MVIIKNSTIPPQKKTVSTHGDYQDSVTIQVYEGERPFCEDNHRLGGFGLMDIPPKKRGVPQIEVSFDLDANGILNVTACDKSSGKSEKIAITNEEDRLSAEDIEKMVQDSNKFKEDDEKRKKRIEAKQSLRSLCENMKENLDPEEKEEMAHEKEENQDHGDGHGEAKKEGHGHGHGEAKKEGHDHGHGDAPKEG